MTYLNPRQTKLLTELLEDVLAEDPSDEAARELLEAARASPRASRLRCRLERRLDPDTPPVDPRKYLPATPVAGRTCACGSEIDRVETDEGPVLLCRDLDCPWEEVLDERRD